MSARLLEGRAVAAAIWGDVDQRSARFAERHGRPATLALLAGSDEAAAAYGRQIDRQVTKHGMQVLTSVADEPDYLAHIRGLSADPGVDGILLLTPLPPGVSSERAA